MAECPTCGDDHFKSERGMKYHHATVHGESITMNEYTCTWCDDTFERHPSAMTDSDKQFCSTDCMSSWVKNEQDTEDAPHWSGGEEGLTCFYCGEFFTRPQSQRTDSDKDFCSTTCWGNWLEENQTSQNHPRWNGGKMEVDCTWCGESVRRKPSAVEKQERVFCSLECQGCWRSENRTGEDAFNWRGGHVENYGPTWLDQRQKALERDDYVCQDCGMTNKEHNEQWDHGLEVHHKTPIRTFEDTREANELTNLITVCKSCHVEREYS